MSRGLIYRDCHKALQKAVYDRLHTWEVGKPCEVYDLAPKGTEYPYITVNEQSGGGDWSSKTFAGQVIDFVIAAWSDFEGNQEAQDIANKASFRLTDWDWPLLDNFKVLNVKLVESRGIVQSDNHMKWIVRFEIHVVDLATVQI